MPIEIKPIDALKRRMSGDAEAVDMPLATRAGFERALVDEVRALAKIAEEQQAINSVLASCLESMSAPDAPEKPGHEEWEVTVTERDERGIRRAKFKRIL